MRLKKTHLKRVLANLNLVMQGPGMRFTILKSSIQVFLCQWVSDNWTLLDLGYVPKLQLHSHQSPGLASGYKPLKLRRGSPKMKKKIQQI